MHPHPGTARLERANATVVAGGESGEPAAESISPAAARKPLPPLATGLYLVATPIGNAADITLRALHVLTEADIVACEDTRVTRKLFAIHGIGHDRGSPQRFVACHDHNEADTSRRLVAAIVDGARVALVSDAGTPLVSDPGYRLVRAAIEAGVPIIPIPGPSAVLAALAVSGLSSDRFFFAGFLPAKAAARRRAIQDLKAMPATLVMLESPRRLAALLADLALVLGHRDAVVARELTKLFEEVRRGTLADLAATYQAMPEPKGEVTVVIAPPTASEAAEVDEAAIERMLTQALTDGSPRDAAIAVAAATGLPRRGLYARALALAGRR
ncbi:MAG: 16S rRNA (cytidine(1402)-2'-O)-methyltransferase [Rhodospirillales bacterium]